MRDGDHERALAAFDAAIAEQPRLPLAHLGRAITLFALGRHEEAGLALDEALSCGDDDGEVLLAVARACVTTGQYGLAMDVLGLAVGAFPTLAEMVSHDPGFVRLRDHPRFLQIVGEL
jgi:Tfp pilus assembly protein PilF